jgi:hypothetical protein
VKYACLVHAEQEHSSQWLPETDRTGLFVSLRMK